jgi:hypothetical protein
LRARFTQVTDVVVHVEPVKATPSGSQNPSG